MRCRQESVQTAEAFYVAGPVHKLHYHISCIGYQFTLHNRLKTFYTGEEVSFNCFKPLKPGLVTLMLQFSLISLIIRRIEKF